MVPAVVDLLGAFTRVELALLLLDIRVIPFKREHERGAQMGL